MDIDYVFFKEIILIIIPTLMAIIGSKAIVNSWQIRNEKSKIKRQILNEYENSAKYMRALMYNFVRKIQDSFTLPAFEDDRHEHIKYTTIKENDIITQFGNEFKKLEDSIDKVEFTASKLISSLRLYYGDEKLVLEHREILAYMSTMHLLIKKILYCNSIEDFNKYSSDFLKKEEKLRDLLQAFEMKLINTNFDKRVI